MKQKRYDYKKIESRWQKKWLESKAFEAREDSGKKKYYELETFPYPSAAGLHVGHPKGYIAEDITARFSRMNGQEVLYTMGWDAFGLPTENYAIKVGKTPKEVAKENIENFKRQVQMFGFSYDWNREINTSSPEYYKWTQWLFLKLYEKGLAYRARARVNWCPKDQTVLANEQVQGGVCERCGTATEQREMEQWFLRITDYAERLLGDLKDLDWPSATLKKQTDWIGKSEGALLSFSLSNISGQPDAKHRVEVFTTRSDTLFGVTFLVISPELAEKWIGIGWQASEEVREYVKKSLKKRELERMENVNEKTGVDTGIKAIHPGTKKEIPVWVADYVLGSYGTGAIMAVPAHDERDFEFAKKFKLPVTNVIRGNVKDDSDVYVGSGVLENSGKFDGMDSEKAKWEITKAVGGEKKIQYKLRDWSVSRQRYWGVPIPMIHCGQCGIVPVSENDLPVVLPDDVDSRPHGMPPLASSTSFINVKCPKCGNEAKRDPETLDTFVDSSWYFLRYTDPRNEKEIFDKKKAKHWLPIDLYVIGAEHTVLHLLYSRFITKFLKDLGYIDFSEPFLKLRHQGLIMGSDGQKMSKSKGNVVNPDEVVDEFGADTMRLYLMFMGPFEDSTPWDSKGILGVHRFLNRFWDYASQVINEKNFSDASKESFIVHKTIKKVTEDIQNFKFNTAISALMILLNEIENEPSLSKEDFESMIKLLHPFAPHVAQELWSELGHETVLDYEAWPTYDNDVLHEATFTLVVQVNGKVRGNLVLPGESGEKEAHDAALQDPNVARWVQNVSIRKVIYIPKKLINFVIDSQ